MSPADRTVLPLLMATVSCLTLPPVSWLAWPEYALDSAISVFRCPVNSPLAVPPTHWLTPTEWHRANRFHQPADRQRFVLGRALFRQVAGQISGQSPEQIAINIGPRGKPEWVNDNGWHVNLAHSGNWVLLALAKIPVGLDVEQIQPNLDVQVLLDSTFTEEENSFINSHEQPQQAFYSLWTRKEALLKATGLGINDRLCQCSVLTGTHPVADETIGSTGHWTVATIDVDAQHPAAVAWAGPLPVVHSPVTCYTV